MGFDIDIDEAEGGGRSGSVFMRSGLGVGERIPPLCCDMAVFDRNRVPGGGGGVRRAIRADCDRTSGVGVCIIGGDMSTSDRKDTDLDRLAGGGVGAQLLDEAALSVLSSGVGEFRDVGERIDDMAVSDRKETCFNSALLGQRGTGVAVLLRGIGFITDELVVAVSTG